MRERGRVRKRHSDNKSARCGSCYQHEQRAPVHEMRTAHRREGGDRETEARDMIASEIAPRFEISARTLDLRASEYIRDFGKRN